MGQIQKQRRFRSPRFAPEALERKLNPSHAMGMPVVVEVMAMDTLEATPIPSERMSVNYGSFEEGEVRAFEITRSEPEIPRPGDPEPINPTPTEPPDGSGDPPIGEPSFPGGPGEPA